MLGRRSYKPENLRQEKLYTYNPGTLTGQRATSTTQDRMKAGGQEAGGILQSLEWWNFWLSKAGRKLNSTSKKNQLWQQWELRLSHSITLGTPPSALLAPQLLIPMIISCWHPFTPHLVLSRECTKWSWQQDSLSYQQHTIIAMPTPGRLLSSACISEAHKIPVRGEKSPTYLCVSGI